jgi:chitodextrinase
VDLAWTASSDNSGVAGYQVSRNGAVVGSVGGTTLTYADHTAAANTTYTYSVTAYDAAGNYSSASNSLQATTAQASASASQLPTILSFTASATTGTWGQTSNLSWTVWGATSLSIDNGVGDVSNYAGIRVALKQTVTYTLTASNAAGSSTAQVTITVTAAADGQRPAARILLSATNRSSDVTTADALIAPAASDGMRSYIDGKLILRATSRRSSSRHCCWLLGMAAT